MWNRLRNHKKDFKDNEAFKIFMSEALILESNLSRTLNHGHCETLYLYVNEETGHIITWYRQGDPASQALDAHYYHIYEKIPWQVRGTA